jgi:Tol biopolymer transport system component
MSASPFRRFALIAVMLATASCELSTGPGDGTSSSGFTLLVERLNSAGERSFYTMSADGNEIAPFTGVPADARALTPSPDGKTIAYLRDAANGYVELWAMDRDGANRRAILSGAYVVLSASWSPDGNRLAVVYSAELVTSDIAIVNVDGSGFVDLTPDPLPGVYLDRDASWSPEGGRIAFSSNRSGVRRLWIMNVDGSDAHQVLPATVESSESQPVWSPDTTNFIAVVDDTPAGPGIAFMRADGTDYKHIAIAPSPADPVWLPDGRLVYVDNAAGDYDLWTVDRLSGATTQLTTRRDDDVRAAVLTDATPFTWLGLAAPVTYQINRPVAEDLAIADVLTDGRPDVMILSPLLNEIRLMSGGINGSLQSVGALFAEADVAALRTGLVTTDNAPDIVGRADSAVYVWRGRSDGPGIATRLTMSGEVMDAAVVDLDGNGRADIVSMIQNTGQPFRLRTHTVNTSDNFVVGADLLTTRLSGRSLCAGDVTGDGLPDIVAFAGETNLSAFLAEGRGDLGVNQPAPAGTSLSADLEAVPYCADFNNDGRDDVALFTANAPQGVSVHRWGTSAFGGATRIAASASAMAIADIDRDGDLDIILASSGAASILVAINRGNGAFSTPTTVTIPNAPIAIATGDLNGDNWPDVVVVDVTGALVVLLSRGRAGG